MGEGENETNFKETVTIMIAKMRKGVRKLSLILTRVDIQPQNRATLKCPRLNHLYSQVDILVHA
jgi:hypothetical protein